MTADTLLARLDKVKTSGHGKWLACCPAHPDKRPSLHIKECDDGRVLVHCFTGCSVGDILAAVGLEFSDLFPEKLDLPDHHKPAERQSFPAKDVLKSLVQEAAIVAVAAGMLRSQGFLPISDEQRLALAYDRLSEALSVIGRVS
jgi:DNA primase